MQSGPEAGSIFRDGLTTCSQDSELDKRQLENIGYCISKSLLLTCEWTSRSKWKLSREIKYQITGRNPWEWEKQDFELVLLEAFA